MALIIPTAYSTYGDSSSTEGGPFGKYVLAQFRSDVDLSWVGSIRKTITTEELKWTIFKSRRPYLRELKDLWNAVVNGMRNAAVIVIDPEPLAKSVKAQLLFEGAEEGHDFGDREIIARCASAVVADTPIAYLPLEIARTLDSFDSMRFLSFERFTPQGIQDKIGKSLKHAKVFAARAHAMFDLPALAESTRPTREAFRSPTARLVMAELLSTTRICDKEHIDSATLLNVAADAIAVSLEKELPLSGTIAHEPLVKEMDSKAIDYLQAADIAAGWAREALDLGDARSLARTFGRVTVNGIVIPE